MMVYSNYYPIICQQIMQQIIQHIIQQIIQTDYPMKTMAYLCFTSA